METKVHDIKTSMLQNGVVVTAIAIKEALTGVSDKKRMLLSVFKVHNDNMAKLIGKDFAPATLTRYQTTHDHVANFLKFKYQLDDIALNALNYEFVYEFSIWLKIVRNCSHNTTVKYISNVKKIVLDAIRKGWLQKDPFIDFKTTQKKVRKIPLSQLELMAIANKTFVNDRITLVRDIFLFSCFTGLAYADVKKLTYSQVIDGYNNDKWIYTERQKTGTPSRIPLLPQALGIMKKYSNHPKCLMNGCVLPILSNQKMNAYLKEIADLCDIQTDLTFHRARRTFASTVALSNKVPIETVRTILGHESVKQTEAYAEVIDEKIAEDMQVVKRRFKNLAC
jgi:integrase